jgi:hypothetical protein
MTVLASIRKTGLALVAATTALSSASAALDPNDTERLRFKVFLDDREIGYHDFTFHDAAQVKTIQSEARFNVKVLFINAFSYAHQNTERWSDGCLVEIAARTDNNGKDLAVDGEAVDEGFVVDTHQGQSQLAADCVKTFAYWNPELRKASRLLNAQTGEYLDVVVTDLGTGSVMLGDREVAVERIRLTAKDTDIEIHYAVDTGEWVALDSRLKKGRVLSYRRVPANATVLAKS